MSTFGEDLKRERELRKIPLREISESTKINLRYLEALERNDFEHLPGGVFARGFVRAYAQYIGIDPETMQIELTIAAQDPEAVDLDAVAAEMPYGQVTARAVHGGLNVPDHAGEGQTIIVNAGILVRLPL